MGLTAHIRRWRYVWGWRVRYWWLDTLTGKRAQWTTGITALLGLLLASVRAGLAVAVPDAIPQPQTAVIWWVVWAVVALVVGVVLALSASKPAAPAEQEAKAPTTQDGRSAVRHYGTRWIDSPAMLAWKVVGRDAIQTKGGKK